MIWIRLLESIQRTDVTSRSQQPAARNGFVDGVFHIFYFGYALDFTSGHLTIGGICGTYQ